jgi:hypothetical protein
MTPRRYYTFMIDPDLAEALKAVKERDHIPESVQIRLAIRQWMEARGVMKAERKRAGTRKRP